MGPAKLPEEPLQWLPPRSIEGNDYVFCPNAREFDVGLRRRYEVKWFCGSQNSACLCLVLVALKRRICCSDIFVLVIVVVLGIVTLGLLVVVDALVVARGQGLV